MSAQQSAQQSARQSGQPFTLGPGAPADLADFVQLIEAYKSISEHVTTWADTTFPATVGLANDVYGYGVNKAPVYYPALLEEARILRDRPDDQPAKEALKAILDNLRKDAEQRANKAQQNNVGQVGMGAITRDRSAAPAVIQKIQGVWGSLSADLVAISRKVDDDIRNGPPIIMDLGVDQAVKARYDVAILADRYRLSAYVQEQPGVVSMAAWKVADQFSSARLAPARLVAA